MGRWCELIISKSDIDMQFWGQGLRINNLKMRYVILIRSYGRGEGGGRCELIISKCDTIITTQISFVFLRINFFNAQIFLNLSIFSKEKKSTSGMRIFCLLDAKVIWNLLLLVQLSNFVI